MKDQVRNLGDHRLHYNIYKRIKQGSFYILCDIREKVSLVKFMENVCNVNHALSIVGDWIFDSNCKI